MMRRSWSQSGLAKHCGVTSRTIRNRLEELQNADPRIERFSDPPQVYWSVPKTWVPDGLVLTQADAEDIARMVARLPKTAQPATLEHDLTDLPTSIPPHNHDVPQRGRQRAP